MNKIMLSPFIALCIGTAAAQSAAVPSALPDAYATYRRVVLWDTSITVPSTLRPAQEGGRWVPGSYARYLMHNGMAKDAALDQARHAGELATYADATRAPEPVQFTSYERYQLTVIGRSQSEIVRDRAAAQRGHSGPGIAASTAR